MKNSEAIVEILEAYDLTGSFHAAADQVGCGRHTVARYMQLQDAGRGSAWSRPAAAARAAVRAPPGGTERFHPQVHFRVTPPTPAQP